MGRPLKRHPRESGARSSSGATLLEILMAMLILMLVSTGILSAFVFTRRVSLRSELELYVQNLVVATADQLRYTVLGLAPGIYVDEKLGADPFIPPRESEPLPALNLPNDRPVLFRDRFQTNHGTAATFDEHGDGRVLVVEKENDLDGDGLAGVDVNGDGTIDLKRVRIRIRWTTPAAGA